MEERAKQRKEKRALLNKQYEDKKAKEVEVRAKFEELKELEFAQKKQAEKDAKRAIKLDEFKRKETEIKRLEDLKAKIKAACDYYKHKLMKSLLNSLR